MKLAQNQAKAKQHSEAKILLSENCLLSSSMLSSKNNRYYKKCAKTSVCFNESIWLIIMKVKLKMKNRLHIDSIKINLGLDLDTNILNIKFVTVW